MRPFRPGLLVLVLASFVVSASAQTTSPSSPPATSDPQAVALIQKALAALTSGAAVTDVTLTGSARLIAGSDEETGTATLKADNLGDSRMDLNLPSGTRTEIRNHSAVPLPSALPPAVPANVAQQTQPSGAWVGPDGVHHAMATQNVVTDAAWFFPAFTLANVVSPNYVLAYIGPENFAGQSVLHVSAWQQFPQVATNLNAAGLNGTPIALFMQHLSQTEIYLDPATSVPVALAFNTHPDGTGFIDIPVKIEFSNYQATNGMQVPFRVQKLLNNDLALDLQPSSVTVNSGFGAVPFQLQ